MGDPNPVMHGISFKATCTKVEGDKATFTSLPGEDENSVVLTSEYSKRFTIGESARVSIDLTNRSGAVGGN